MIVSLTKEDEEVLRTGAFGAIYLVSTAEPGFFEMILESYAAAEALVSGSSLVRQVLAGGPQPEIPRWPAEEVAAVVLPALRESVAILCAKAPEAVEAYRRTVLSAVRQVAEAAHGVQPAEQAWIDRIELALQAPPPG